MKMELNIKLLNYIEKNIIPMYDLNEDGHGRKHVIYVIKRSLHFAKQCNVIDIDMVYTIAAYHDCGHHIDPKNHEKISADILREDKKLKKYFSEEEIEIMAQAIEDHRSSSKHEPRSIYGKIVSTADKRTDPVDAITSTYYYRKEHYPNDSLEQIISDSLNHLRDKFKPGGYSEKTKYFDDPEYEMFLEQINKWTANPEEFAVIYKKINKIS